MSIADARRFKFVIFNKRVYQLLLRCYNDEKSFMERAAQCE